MKKLATSLIAAALAACSSHEPGDVDADAGLSRPAPRSVAPEPSAIRIAAELGARDALLTRMLSPAPESLVLEPSLGFASVGRRDATRGLRDSLGALAPETADGAFTVSIGASRLLALTLTPEGASTAPGRAHEGRVSYEDKWLDTDSVIVADRERAEELLVLRGPDAPHSFSWRVELGERLGVPRRASDGAIELPDLAGQVVLRLPPAFALDAAGTRRDAEVTLQGDRLTVALDTRGLRWPVLLDPAVESVVWSNVASGSPSARRYSALAYSDAASKTFLFGGDNGTCVGCYLGDTWSWNGAAWTQVCATGACGITARTSFAYGFDARAGRKRLVVFGGSTGGAPVNETWEFNGTTWTQVCTASCTPPSARSFAAMASSNNGVALFGGSSASLNDLWTWDGTTWTNVQCPGGCAADSTHPAGRQYAALAGDGSGKLVLFGGRNSSAVYLNDTWEWNGSAWSQKCTTAPCTTSMPSIRGASAFTYDSARKRYVLVGGFDGSQPVDETWEWDGAAWTRTATSTPGARHSASATFDSGRGRMIVFGGRDATPVNLDQTWEYHTRGGGCTLGSQCDTGICKDTVCCETACTGSCTSCDQAALPGVCAAVLNAEDSDTCATTQYCNGAGACTAKKAPGAACVATGECQSGYVCSSADGVCCTSDCSGVCQSCLAAQTGQAAGTCANVSAGQDPANECGTVESASTCGFDGYCGGGQCRKYPSGTECVAAVCTAPNTFAPARTCNGTGTCGAGSSGPCPGGYRCNGTTACYSSCTDDAQCMTGYYCNAAGTCAAQKLQGNGCNQAAGADCKVAGCGVCGSAGGCIDGYCCNTVCGGQCDACNGAALGWAAATNGTCKAAPSTYGGNPSCGGGVLCDGASSACPGGCTSDAQCGVGYYCSALGACAAQKSQASACNTAQGADCAVAGCRVCGSAGGCVDGFCCDAACGTACQSCGLAGTVGTCSPVSGADDAPQCTGNNTCSAASSCKKKNGQTCSAGSECASGSCADGVCCNTACAGACDACSVAAGAAVAGTCSNVGAGAPGNPACGATLCNGSTATCPTTCTSDSGCGAAYYCAYDSTCRPRKAQGAACDAGVGGDCLDIAACRLCASAGGCVDGVCCNSACSGSCNACSVTAGATVNGTCANVAPGGTGNPSCGGTVCSGTSASCPTTCVSDAGCAPTHYCDQNQTCQLRKPQGSACNDAPGQDCFGAGCRVCASAACTDGVCCQSACDQPCQHCAAGTGSCTSVTSADDAPECTTPNTCSAAGSCKKKNGQTCTSVADCASGNCADGVCCNTPCSGACDACSTSAGAAQNGTCASVTGAGNPSCTPLVCSGTSPNCPGGCSTDTDCGATTYCAANGQCLPRKGTGQVCNAGAGYDCQVGGCRVCTSGNCVDGVCCGSSCGGACDVCSAALGATADGTCSPAPNTFPGSPSCTPYQCGGTAGCPSTCDSDAACATGYYCDAAQHCSPRKPDGATCSLAAGANCYGAGCRVCSSGNCVDGVCCQTACVGACDACDGATRGWPSAIDGLCAIAPDGTSAAACGLALCDGASATCPGGCVTDGDCGASAYCRGSDSTCQPRAAQGGACTRVGECSTGNCVDGVCCNSPCIGNCQACSASETGLVDGTCGDVLKGRDPHANCADQPPCGNDGQCNGDGTCSYYAPGASCGASVCQGNQAVGSVCDGAGVCTQSTGTDCTPYVCSGTGCPTTCTSSSDCVAGYWCDGSVCAPLQAVGTSCSSADACQSQFCADGVCCDQDCSGQCEACAEPGSIGACIAVGGDPRGSRAACTASGGECGGECDASLRAACTYPTAVKSCGSPTCTGGSAHASHCDGAGACDQDVNRSCAPYQCGASACLSACTGDGDCVSGFICSDAQECIPTPSGKCSADLTQALDADGVLVATCTPYFCSNGQCANDCSSTDDCAAGYVCDSTAQCEPKKGNAASADDGGCGCRAAGRSTPRGSLGWLALALLAAGAARRDARPSTRRALARLRSTRRD